jgi:hypothetical protein
MKNKLYKGIGLVEKIININPTLEELTEMYPEYTGEKSPVYSGIYEGNQWCKLDFYLQVKGADMPIKITYFLSDQTEYTKNGKTWYINQIWETMSSQTKADLPEYFTKAIKKGTFLFNYTYREAFKGESILIPFLRSIFNDLFLAGSNKYNDKFQINIDHTALFNGDTTKFINAILNKKFTPFYCYFYNDGSENKIYSYGMDIYDGGKSAIYDRLNSIYISNSIDKESEMYQCIKGYKDLPYSKLLKKLINDEECVNNQLDIDNELQYGYITEENKEIFKFNEKVT